MNLYDEILEDIEDVFEYQAKSNNQFVKSTEISSLFGFYAEFDDDVCDLFEKSELSDNEKEKVLYFKDCFYKTVPVESLDFYEALSPEFFSWLKSV